MTTGTVTTGRVTLEGATRFAVTLKLTLANSLIQSILQLFENQIAKFGSQEKCQK